MILNMLTDSSKKYRSLELCAGAGGQALGIEAAGFEHAALIEIDRDACLTLKANRPDWNVIQVDLNTFDASPFSGVDLLAAGVPCPPFSRAGRKLGVDDERNLFPATIEILKGIKPRSVMLENVRGFLDSSFAPVREELKSALASEGLELRWSLVKSSAFGVPQLRPRAIGIGLPPALWPFFEWPRDSSDYSTVGDVLYTEMSSRGWLGADSWRLMANKIAPTLVGGSKKHGGPDLGPTRSKRQWAELGVDGLSIADEPPGPDFLGKPRLTVKMAALLQGFPADWKFIGKKTSCYRQVGNAFPPPVSSALASEIRSVLECADSVPEALERKRSQLGSHSFIL